MVLRTGYSTACKACKEHVYKEDLQRSKVLLKTITSIKMKLDKRGTSVMLSFINDHVVHNIYAVFRSKGAYLL